MVEMASDMFVCIVDDSKLVKGLGGSKLAMPVEIVQFCHEYTLKRLQARGKSAALPFFFFSKRERVPLGDLRIWGRPGTGLPHPRTPIQELPEVKGCVAKLRKNADGSVYVTDNSNYIVDLYFEQDPIKDAYAASKAILALEGVVDHGLFMVSPRIQSQGGQLGYEADARSEKPCPTFLWHLPVYPRGWFAGHGGRLHHRWKDRRRGAGEEEALGACVRTGARGWPQQNNTGALSRWPVSRPRAIRGSAVIASFPEQVVLYRRPCRMYLAGISGRGHAWVRRRPGLAHAWTLIRFSKAGLLREHA